MNTLTPHPRTEKQVTRVVLESPFFATLLLHLKRVYTDSVPTMATNGKDLLINPVFAETLTDGEIKAVLVHEVLHCAFGHMFRRGDRDPQKWNEAADYAINLIVEEFSKSRNGDYKLPKGCLLDPQYKDMGAEAIYAKLPPPPKGGQGKGQGKGQPQPGQGNPLGDDIIEDPDVTPEEAEALAREWQGRMVQADQAARMQGNQPGFLSRLVGELINPKLPWRQLLQKFLTEKVKSDYDWMKPDRRFLAHDLYLPDIGDEEAAGEIVVVVDTSGSIDGDLLNSFFSEINGIHKTLRPTKLLVMYCDAKVHEPVDEFGPDDDIVPSPKGGGGTSFAPAFQWLNDNNINPQCLVYLTDLYGSFPQSVPHYPVLWACWSKETEAPFGEVISVD